MRIKNIHSIYLDMLPNNEEATSGKGPLPSKYAFVGVAPSMNRPTHRKNEPFGTSAWSLLEKILEKEPEIYVTNLIKTPFPSNKKPPKKLIREYYPSLEQELKLVQPKRILALGEIPAAVLCPSFTSMREDHGTIFWNPEIKSYVVPAYDFASINRNPDFRRIFVRDLQRFFELPDPIEPTVYEVEDVYSLLSIFKESKRIYLDIETSWKKGEEGSLNDRITLIGIGSNLSDIVHVIRNPTKQQLRDLISIQREAGVLIVGQNLIFDLSMIDWWSGWAWLPPVKDTMIIAHCLGLRPLNLKHLTTMYTDRPGSRAFGGTESLGYLGEDVLSTKYVHRYLEKRLREHKIEILPTLHSITPSIAMMHATGVYIDYKKIGNVLQRSQRRLDNIERKLKAEADINWGSNKQVVEVFKEKNIPLRVRTKTGYSVAEKPLLDLRRKGYLIPKILLQRRARSKEVEFLNSYWGLLTKEHPYLHPRLLIAFTDTGRPSCRDPNLQQVTRTGPLKSLFVSRWKGGSIGLFDLAQAELRTAALIHSDKRLATALSEGDAHKVIAGRLYNKAPEDITGLEKKKSKGVTFGSLFLGGAKGLAERTGFPVAEVRKLQERFWKEYPELRAGFDRQIKHCLRERRIVGHLGRIRDIDTLIKIEGGRGASRKIVNTPIQQLASDLLLILFDDILRFCKEEGSLRTIPLMTIHDAILFDIYPGEEDSLIQAIDGAFDVLREYEPLMRLPLWSSLPIKGELIIGSSWAECESTNEGYNPRREIAFTT